LRHALAANHTAPGDHLKLRAKRFAESGFAGMIRPFSMLRKPQIYLLDPYDPNKMPLLMIHGLHAISRITITEQACARAKGRQYARSVAACY
jgi:hypothetical protein